MIGNCSQHHGFWWSANFMHFTCLWLYIFPWWWESSCSMNHDRGYWHQSWEGHRVITLTIRIKVDEGHNYIDTCFNDDPEDLQMEKSSIISPFDASCNRHHVILFGTSLGMSLEVIQNRESHSTTVEKRWKVEWM